MRQAIWSNIDTPHHIPLLQGRRPEGEPCPRLGRGRPVLRNGLLRSGHFLDRDERFARAAVEHIDIALLGGADKGGNRPFHPAGDVEKRRLGGHVHVPEIVMHRLGAPSAPRRC